MGKQKTIYELAQGYSRVSELVGGINAVVATVDTLKHQLARINVVAGNAGVIVPVAACVAEDSLYELTEALGAMARDANTIAEDAIRLLGEADGTEMQMAMDIIKVVRGAK